MCGRFSLVVLSISTSFVVVSCQTPYYKPKPQSYLQGTFTEVLDLFSLSPDIVTPWNYDLNITQMELNRIQIYLTELNKLLLSSINRLGKISDWQQFFQPYLTSITLINKFASDLQTLEKSSNLQTWSKDVSTSIDTALFTLHSLSTDGANFYSYQSLIEWFYERFTVDDEFQSRLWKTEAFADLFVTQQAIGYGLWSLAISVSGGQINVVKQLCHTRLQQQLANLAIVQQMPNYYHIPTGTESILSICATTPICLTSGYSLNVKPEQIKADLYANCLQNSTFVGMYNWAGQKCVVKDSRDYIIALSDEMLKVSDRNRLAICGFAMAEESDSTQFGVKVVLKAKVCEKVANGRLKLANSTLLQTKKFGYRWNYDSYTISASLIPRLMGWITEIGLKISSDRVAIQMRTEYFPPIHPIPYYTVREKYSLTEF